MQQLPSDAAIRDTITAVFQTAEYSRSWQEVLLGKLWLFALRAIAAVARAADEHPAMFWVSVAFVVVSLSLLLGRGAYLARKRAELSARASRFGANGEGPGSDAWRLAQQLAASGNYTEAAHALYRHLLQWLARSGSVQVHPSKTVGDYSRELRARSSADLGGYRNFARSYEVVIYGVGYCDRERFDRLLSLASVITRQHG